MVVVEMGQQHWSTEEVVAEFRHLVESAGLAVIDVAVVKRKEITPSIYIGTGKAEELAAFAQDNGADVVIFNNNLSSAQQRNLEDQMQVKTIDRTQLILDIFALHARTQEGKLQVELAQLHYLLPRLKGKGIMLSRLGGGIGTRGPGETKLEVDRRKISDRIARLESDLESTRSSRETMRKKRRKEKLSLCSLVGYTSAGKTTLFNAFTAGNEKTAGTLFTTLDTISHAIVLHENLKVILSDTVGFISDLPPQLIEAFKSTLEELDYADVLLHVIDASSPQIDRLHRAVDEVLSSLKLGSKPLVLVFNKIDKLTPQELAALRKDYPEAVFISALNGTNIDVLKEKIYALFDADIVEATLHLPFNLMAAVKDVHAHCQVLKTDYDDKGALYWVKAKKLALESLARQGVTVKAVDA